MCLHVYISVLIGEREFVRTRDKESIPKKKLVQKEKKGNNTDLKSQEN